MSHPRRTVLLAQLPIPPLGPELIRGNVPLAAAYLKLFADSHGLDHDYAIDVFPAALASSLGDRALAAALAERRPWMVGFTCYLWNVERTLHVAAELKRLLPGVRVVLGGPEITADNAWVLNTPDYDFAAVGEGEQTFANLLLALLDEDLPPVPIAGLYVPATTGPRYRPERLPAFRTPMPDLSRLGSPYLAGILDAAEERMMLLETTRGCVFKCKFCYYPKSYDKQYYLPADAVLAALRHANEKGAEEVVLLDPTLNQRRDFEDFLRLLIAGNPGRRMSYFGELRGEGIKPRTAALLREAGFTHVEVGLQSIEPDAMTLMDRRNNLKAFATGVRAMLAEGIRVTVDLIVGLPGDTVESVRHGFDYLLDEGLYSDVQVFNLAVLPGTAFRQEAKQLGLTHQPRPPYYVLHTPSLGRVDLFGLIEEAQDRFGMELDPLPPPFLDFGGDDRGRLWKLDLDRDAVSPPPADERALAFTLWLCAADLMRHEATITRLIRTLLGDNPFTTLQVVLEPSRAVPDPEWLSRLFAACQEDPTYLDRFYSLQPGRAAGSRRLVVVLDGADRPTLAAWSDAVADFVTVVWRGDVGDLDDHEFALPPGRDVAAIGRSSLR
jgi:radical SAM superfamily enzyme YgiQ (UPF0313 family)